MSDCWKKKSKKHKAFIYSSFKQKLFLKLLLKIYNKPFSTMVNRGVFTFLIFWSTRYWLERSQKEDVAEVLAEIDPIPNNVWFFWIGELLFLAAFTEEPASLA